MIGKVKSLSCVCVILCLAVLVEHRLVTHRQTDRQTQTQAHWLVPRMRSIVRLKRKMVRKVSKTIIRTKSSHNCRLL